MVWRPAHEGNCDKTAGHTLSFFFVYFRPAVCNLVTCRFVFVFGDMKTVMRTENSEDGMIYFFSTNELVVVAITQIGLNNENDVTETKPNLRHTGTGRIQPPKKTKVEYGNIDTLFCIHWPKLCVDRTSDTEVIRYSGNLLHARECESQSHENRNTEWVVNGREVISQIQRCTHYRVLQSVKGAYIVIPRMHNAMVFWIRWMICWTGRLRRG